MDAKLLDDPYNSVLTEQEVEKALKKCQIRFGKEDTS